ncbi:hypothetical protein [Enterovirga rhinocerotis]|uniref:Uncharacterized protein n=1 Tax=Enterovirga rhinocerotis TaxID=1339210 RepID=A0A4R7CEA2_9HYPH|nr:hypothetical protein [Enterovirga rhinocerotis]TDR95891.1 hypothetical protein EV668_0005 [Enterovirga rhinocerotis]
MTDRKLADHPLDDQVPQVPRRPDDKHSLPRPAEGPREHANVEMESGPVDREERDDPFPEMP